ncbi:MAG: hypothetical protein MZU84_06515 [Sphingobacterium sp.]|nr:hypothetical protein [Sphingobacterium sp.]
MAEEKLAEDIDIVLQPVGIGQPLRIILLNFFKLGAYLGKMSLMGASELDLILEIYRCPGSSPIFSAAIPAPSWPRLCCFCIIRWILFSP